MLRHRHFCLLALLSVLATIGPARANDFAASLVRVRATDTDGTTQFGSGVGVAPDRVATACHVTRAAVAIEIERGDQRWLAHGQTGSTLHDLCIVSVEHADITVAHVRASSDLHLGERVIAAGFQGGGERVVTKVGTVVALYPYDGGPVIRTTAAFDFGSSGGGLFDEAGNLVGLLAFKARSGENLRFALPSEWMLPANTVTAAFAPVTPTSATSAFWERPQADRPSFLGVALREAASPRD